MGGDKFTILLDATNAETAYGFEITNITPVTSEKVFTLPSGLKIIENEAFKGIPAKKVKVPTKTDVKNGAFDSGVTIERY